MLFNNNAIALQRCNQCGATFLVQYNRDGSYTYYDEPCDCDSDFSPVNGELSISEWIKRVEQDEAFYTKWKAIDNR